MTLVEKIKQKQADIYSARPIGILHTHQSRTAHEVSTAGQRVPKGQEGVAARGFRRDSCRATAHLPDSGALQRIMQKNKKALRGFPRRAIDRVRTLPRDTAEYRKIRRLLSSFCGGAG